jgi:triphosphoribosyl-dephospho-CoA synthase
MCGVNACHTVPSRALRELGRQAVRALYLELTLEPKPGLVSLRDAGSHADMDASTLWRSLFALRAYFPRMAFLGALGASMAELERCGREAEERMGRATHGVNTHRGAIFCLGLLCASAGAVLAQGESLSPEAIRSELMVRWGRALGERAATARRQPPSRNGQRVVRLHGLRGANDEAAEGFPVLFDVTLPALRTAFETSAGERAARVQALFATISVLDDTNLVHRGGMEGLRFAQAAAAEFLCAGGVLQEGWVEQAREVHTRFVARRLSPGGAADLLGCACWLHAVCSRLRASVPAPIARSEAVA